MQIDGRATVRALGVAASCALLLGSGCAVEGEVDAPTGPGVIASESPKIPTEDEIRRSAEEVLKDIEGRTTTRCTDVTSFDYNWKNDMRCVRPDGSIFYTDYAGAARAQRQVEKTPDPCNESQKSELSKFFKKAGLCD